MGREEDSAEMEIDLSLKLDSKDDEAREDEQLQADDPQHKQEEDDDNDGEEEEEEEEDTSQDTSSPENFRPEEVRSATNSYTTTQHSDVCLILRVLRCLSLPLLRFGTDI